MLVDIHTHVYLPRYAALLRSRSSVPFIRSKITSDGKTEDRLLILDHEPSGGRPVGAQYWNREGSSHLCYGILIDIATIEKLRFMDNHGIDVSVVRYPSTRPK